MRPHLLTWRLLVKELPVNNSIPAPHRLAKVPWTPPDLVAACGGFGHVQSDRTPILTLTILQCPRRSG